MIKDNKNNMLDNLSRLEWACRRGMLELDVLLGKFLREAYSELPIIDKKRFVMLLECSDPELFAWLMGHATPDDNDLAHIVQKIRQHAHTGI